MFGVVWCGVVCRGVCGGLAQLQELHDRHKASYGELSACSYS